MVIFCPAKVNLGLQIIQKRADGYHNIASVFHAIPFYDVLEMIPAQEMSFRSSGIKIPGNTEDNLILKAYHLLKVKHDLPCLKIHLIKNIPMGAGLGGGSSDAACFLVALNDYFKLDLSINDLKDYASEIGSDCPFFIKKGTQLAEDKGEKLKPVDLNLAHKKMVLLFPGIHISTPEAYSNVSPKKPEQSLENIIKKPISEWKSLLTNDFEPSIFKKHPLIKKLKEQLYQKGAEYASMSGSGSTLFGIFDNNVDLEQFNFDAPTKIIDLSTD